MGEQLLQTGSDRDVKVKRADISAGFCQKITGVNSFHALEAIWRVLRRYSSRRHPLTVQEIYEYLRRLESEPPSLSTLERSLRNGTELMEALFPGQVVPAAADSRAVTAYQEGGAIHVVVETPEGEPLDGEAPAVEASIPPFRAPSYSTIDSVHPVQRAGYPRDRSETL